MDTFEYSDTEIHSWQHDGFIETLGQIVGRFDTGDSGHRMNLGVEVHQFLGQWLIHHIGTTDQRLGLFLKKELAAQAAKSE